MIQAKDLEQRWYRPRELPTLPLDVVIWWVCGPAGIVQSCPLWNLRNRIERGEITHLWPISRPLPPGMTEEDDI